MIPAIDYFTVIFWVFWFVSIFITYLWFYSSRLQRKTIVPFVWATWVTTICVFVATIMQMW